MNALHDKAELKQRNTAYKVTLEYCPETCDDVDELFINAFVKIARELHLEDKDRGILIDHLEQLKGDIKDVGTMKLRQAFTTYVLENTTEKG